MKTQSIESPQAILSLQRLSSEPRRASSRVYILGSFERLITIYSQQMRALNLVAALATAYPHREGGSRLAVIGGGPAGSTAALAAAYVGYEVTIFEEHEPFWTFRAASQRWVHPRLFEWPDAEWFRRTAGLPFLNWQAGPIERVVSAWRAELEAAIASGTIVLNAPGEFRVGLNSDKPMV